MDFAYRNQPKKKGQSLENREVIPGSSIRILLDDDDRYNEYPEKIIPCLGERTYNMQIEHGDEMNGHIIISKDTKPKLSKQLLAEIAALRSEAEDFNDGLNRISFASIENAKALPFIDTLIQSKPHLKSITLKDISYAWSLGIDFAFYINSTRHKQPSIYAGDVKKIKGALSSLYILEPGERPTYFPTHEIIDFTKYPKPLELVFFYVAHYKKIVNAHRLRFKNFNPPEDPTPAFFPLLLNETIRIRGDAAAYYLWRKGEPLGEYLVHLEDCPDSMSGPQKNALYFFKNLYDSMLKAFFKEKAKKNIELQKKVHENIDNISKVIGDHESAASTAVSKCVALIEKRYGVDVAKDVGGAMFALNKRCSESLGKVNDLARRNLYEASFRVADAGDKIAANHFSDLCNFIYDYKDPAMHVDDDSMSDDMLNVLKD